jgi:hypothetical protein
MRLIWTGEEPVSETRLTLKARGYEPSQLGLSEQAVCRIGRRFPVLISQSGRFVGDAFSFLFDVAFVRGSTRSARTLETYAESLLSWLKYAEDKGVQWRKPTSAMLAAYRDNMLGTDGQDRRNTRPARRSSEVSASASWPPRSIGRTGSGGSKIVSACSHCAAYRIR